MNEFPLFAAEVGWPHQNVVVARRLGSTQTLARRIAAVYAADGEPAPPFWVLAHAQESGRGRRGRTWSSPPGRGIYATRGVTAAEVDEPGRLPLAIALALAEALDEFLPPERPVRLKWPNDLIVAGRKLGGVLIEAPTDTAGALLVGFGVNHGHSTEELAAVPGAESGRAATSLTLEGGPVPGLGATARALIGAVEAEIARRGELPELVHRYAARSLHRPGDLLACKLGERVVTGIFRGFGPAGELRLATEGGETNVAAGEILEPFPEVGHE
ncbi:MAG: biotin--[acetyl-CoA-carboxylase] ligase [Thermoanaerobaculia bacterium]|nr:biotin--[acetyl-CoA-carboxylase] ligase [Thermoanaerobaculia bacterium]